MATTEAVREKITANTQNVTVLPFNGQAGSAPMILLDVAETQLTSNLVATAAVADVALLVVSARSGAEDMRKKRDGELFNRAILAHALGIRGAVLAITETKGTSEEDVAEVEALASQMMENCGFAKMHVTTVRLPCTADEVASALATQRSIPRILPMPERSTRFTATMMALNGNITVGSVMSGFSVECMKLRVVAIEGADEIRLHQTGRCTFEIVDAVAMVDPCGTLVCHQDGKIIATGNVNSVEAPVCDELAQSQMSAVASFDMSSAVPMKHSVALSPSAGVCSLQSEASGSSW